jgi:HSP20 family protein
MAFDTDPFHDLLRLQDQLASLLGTAPDARSSWGGSTGVYPPINIFRGPDRLVIRSELPDVRPEDVSLTVEGRQLTITGERRPPDGAGGGYHRRERPWGRFARTVHLPDDLDLEQVDAQCRNGVLTVSIPVAASARPRQITVKANA